MAGALQRDGVDWMRLAIMFRAPPPFIRVAGTLWTADATVRKVTVIGALGEVAEVHEMYAARRRNGWVAYGDLTLSITVMVTAGQLDPAEEGVLWARGWRTRAAKALRAAQALR